MILLNGREVEIEKVDGYINEGAWIVKAAFVDDGSELSDADMSLLDVSYQANIYDMFYEMQVARAESASEGYDR